MLVWRVVSATDECSERVLALTQALLQLNPGHYAVWSHRQRLLGQLKSFAVLTRERDTFTAQLARDHPKSYQLWQHRQFLVQSLLSLEHADASPSAVLDCERRFLGNVLDGDAKNYHAWSYRQWLVQRCHDWSHELGDCEHHIVLDPRNNSAWNHRYFYWTRRPEASGLTNLQWSAELEFIWQWILRSPGNESPWNYLRGWVRVPGAPVDGLRQAFDRAVQLPATKQVRSIHAYAFMVDSVLELDPNSNDLIEQCRGWCMELANRLDTLHRTYWLWRHDQL